MKTTMEELLPYMRGWRSYFGFCETPVVLQYLTRWSGCGFGPLCGGSGKHSARISAMTMVKKLGG
jgi:hypothetical protein